MKSLIKFFTIIFCFELIVSPISTTGVFMTTEAWANSCPAGLEFNSTLNRCLTSQQTSEVMNATSKCAPNDSKCFKENAENAFQKSVNEGKVSERKEMKSNGAVQSLAFMVPLAMGLSGLKENLTTKCSSYSFYAMVAGAVSVIAGDLLANMGHNKRLGEIKKSWGKIVNPEDVGNDKDKAREASINAQSKAFEKLAESEESLAKAAKMKKTFFTIAGIAYTVSAALAASELLFPGKGICKPKESTESTTETTTETTTDPQVETIGEPTVVEPPAEVTVPEVEVTVPNDPVPFDSEIPGLDVQGGAHFDPRDREEINNGRGFSVFPGQSRKKEVIAEAPINLNNDNFELKNFLSEKEKRQIQYNLESSADMVSFLVNKESLSNKYQSPSIEEYERISKIINNDDFKDKETFETFKAFTVQLVFNLIPISSAHALVAEETQTLSDGGSSGGGGGASGTPSTTPGKAPESNAASTFKHMEKAKSPLKGLIAAGILGLAIGKFAGKYVGKYLMHPGGRLAFSGLMSILTFKMAGHAGEQAKIAEERAEFLRKMASDFNQAGTSLYACKSEDRNNPGMPNCYCYTAEGQRNNNRGNSQVCQKMWGQLAFKPGQYNGLDTSKMCVAKNGNPDPACKCREAKSCLQVSVPKIAGFSAGAVNMVNSSLDPMNKLNDGTLASAQVSDASLAASAARMRQLVKKLEGQKGLKNFVKDKDKMQNSMLSALTKAGGGSAPSNNLASAGFGSMPSSPAEAVKALEKEFESQPQGFSNGNVVGAPTGSGAEEALEFGMTEGQLADQEGQIAEAMKQDLDYGGNDINQGSKTNIFEVLSNRYQRSGMRRLFDEKGETKADEAAKSDINK